MLFGGGCQFLSGILNFANKNMLGGTLLTAFSFNWVMNWWALEGLATGHAPNAAVVLAVGASLSGQASRGTRYSRRSSA